MANVLVDGSRRVAVDFPALPPISMPELSRFNFNWLFSRFKLDGCRLSVDGSRLIVAGGGFLTLDFSREIAGSFFALDISLLTELGIDLVLPFLCESFVVLAPFDGDEFFEPIF